MTIPPDRTFKPSPIDGNALFFNVDDLEGVTAVLPNLLRQIFINTGLTIDQYLDRYWLYFLEHYPESGRREFVQKTAADRKFLLDKNRITPKMLKNILKILDIKIQAFEYDTSIDTTRIDVVYSGTTDAVHFQAKGRHSSKIAQFTGADGKSLTITRFDVGPHEYMIMQDDTPVKSVYSVEDILHWLPDYLVPKP